MSSKRIYKDDYVSSGVPFFRSSEVVELHDKKEVVPEIFITAEKYNLLKEKYGVPNVGDLLVTSVGTIGKTWIVDNRKFYYKDGNLTLVKKSEKFEMRYLQWFMQSIIFQMKISETVSGSAYNALTLVKFKRMIFPFPILSEQKEIVRILDEIFAKEQQAQSVVESVLADIELLKKSILARAFRGELGTGNPEDERAEELLKRVL